MIKIDKSSVPVPATLTNPDIQTKLNLIWNEGTPDKNLINANIYRSDDVIKTLASLYYNKCAYCETYDPQFEVEHYRPKKLVAVEDRTPNQDHNGYYWLSYEWTNLMPSCHDCNKNGVKGNRFPTANQKKNIPDIFGTNVNLTSNDFRKSYLLDEKPIFLNPEEPDFDPFKYFEFDKDGFMNPKPISPCYDFTRSDTTIKVFQLNREKIFASFRKWHISKIIKRISLLFVELLANEIKYSYFKKKYFEILDEIYVETKPERQYSFFWNYFYQNIDTYILNHIDKEASDYIKPVTQEFKEIKNNI